MVDKIKKLKFRDTPTVINAPEDLSVEFDEMDFPAQLEKGQLSKNTLVFINDNSAYLNFLNNDLVNIEPDSVLWFAYPKGTSKIKTDINRDTIRETGEQFGITTVTAVSINETWSALRFRPIERVGK
ncbi:MAG: hypothetical protein EOO88_14445 [Pedobacter sp.]|nr:MAG: hypothetical protein EOO88_14445 [Pedobacter sp.]